MATAKPDFEQREFLIWLRGVERRAILPLKWAILVIAVVFWILSHPNFFPPPVDVFALFVFYLAFNVGESYFLWFSTISLPQIHRFCIVSYCADILFVTVLIYFDAGKYPAVDGPATDFYIFYFLLILRGFALFRSPRENLLANSVIGAVFILTVAWQDTAMVTYATRNNMIRIVFIWLVILMSWFIVEIINRQKAEIMRARENLLRSENLAILGELAAGVAHEINNPIGIISSYAEFLKKNAAAGDPNLEDYEAIHKEAQRCKEIVQELLEYAAPRSHVMVQTDLRELNNEVLDFVFRRSTRDGIRVQREYPDDLPKVVLDTNEFKQALLNIFLNARQAMSNGGTLRVVIRADEERAGIRQRVEDTGGGIDPTNLRRVFDPFFTTRHKGTGLGLSITKRIIETHGGQIIIESTKGKGTAVEFFLPYETTAAG